jgi:hypothetical protein
MELKNAISIGILMNEMKLPRSIRKVAYGSNLSRKIMNVGATARGAAGRYLGNVSKQIRSTNPPKNSFADILGKKFKRWGRSNRTAERNIKLNTGVRGFIDRFKDEISKR